MGCGPTGSGLSCFPLSRPRLLNKLLPHCGESWRLLNGFSRLLRPEGCADLSQSIASPCTLPLYRNTVYPLS